MKRPLTVSAIAFSCVACTDHGAGASPSGPETASDSTTGASTVDTTASSSVSTSSGGDSTTGTSTSTGTTSSSNGGSTATDTSSAVSSSDGTMGSTAASGGGTTTSMGGLTSQGSTDSSAGGSAGNSTGGGSGTVTPNVLVFSRTTGYRHVSIEAGVQALQGLAQERGWTLAATEDPTTFSDEGLAAYNVLVFLSTTDEVLDDNQQAAMETFIRAGNGYVGIHAASDTEFYWPWYGELVGAYFNAHPDIQEATIVVEDSGHPSTAHLSGTWTRADEWYGFVTNPRDEVNVLLSLDEQSYTPGAGAMGGDHPIAWYHEYDGGRSFYTALGHTTESYTEAAFLEHVAGGIEWASGAVP